LRVRVNPRNWRCRRSRSRTMLSEGSSSAPLFPSRLAIGISPFWGWGGSGGKRETVVLGEISRLGPGFPERLLEPLCRRFRNVLVEGARRAVGGEDTLYGAQLHGTKGSGVTECAIDVTGAIALAQEQDLASLMAPNTAGGSRHQPKKNSGLF